MGFSEALMCPVGPTRKEEIIQGAFKYKTRLKRQAVEGKISEFDAFRVF